MSALPSHAEAHPIELSAAASGQPYSGNAPSYEQKALPIKGYARVGWIRLQKRIVKKVSLLGEAYSRFLN